MSWDGGAESDDLMSLLVSIQGRRFRGGDLLSKCLGFRHFRRCDHLSWTIHQCATNTPLGVVYLSHAFLGIEGC